jgi:hypothetical protein
MKDNILFLCHLPNLEEAEKTQATEKVSLLFIGTWIRRFNNLLLL